VATLNTPGPVNPNNLVARFNDYVAATANSNISWGSNAAPFSEWSYLGANIFGGSTSGMGNQTGDLGLGGVITAQDIVSKFSAATASYTRIRKLRARLNVTGPGGNLPGGPASLDQPIYGPPDEFGNATVVGIIPGIKPPRTDGPGIVIDETQVANLSTSYLQSVGAIDSSGIQKNRLISKSNFQGGSVFDNQVLYDYIGFFEACRARYITLRDATVTVTVDVCHAICHNSCHRSRTRR
jgi:hypothetical protein